MSVRIEKFTDLIAWQNAHKLVLSIYKLVEKFPPKEFSLSDQIKRCVVSISSNIAEGFSRNGRKEKMQFYFIAKGSLTELQNQLLIARDLTFISSKNFLDIAEQTITVHKLINGLLKSARDRS